MPKPLMRMRLLRSCGTVASTRVRCLPMKIDTKMSKRIAIRAGKLDTGRGPASGYVVFTDSSSVPKALKLNMSEVSLPCMVRRQAAWCVGCRLPNMFVHCSTVQ